MNIGKIKSSMGSKKFLNIFSTDRKMQWVYCLFPTYFVEVTLVVNSHILTLFIRSGAIISKVSGLKQSQALVVDEKMMT